MSFSLKVFRMRKKVKKPNNDLYTKIAKIVIVLAVIFFAVNGSYYYVNEQGNAVVTMLGKVVRTDTAGLYFKIPFIQQVEKVDVTTHGTGVGYSIDGNGQSICVFFRRHIMILPRRTSITI